MLWRASGLSSLEEYLESSLGVRQSLFPTVLGLKLAEDLDLGRRFELRDHTKCIHYALCLINSFSLCLHAYLLSFSLARSLACLLSC